jgi:hypothetical protein
MKMIVLLPVCLAACGEVDEPVDGETAAIIGGTALTETQARTYALAAVFSRAGAGQAWWPRPCSGVILRSSGGVSDVLTARHCITVDGSINGTPLAVSNLRVMAGADVRMSNGNPPAGALTPTFVEAMRTTIGTIDHHDMALIRVNADWSNRVTARQGILVRNPSTLADDEEPLLAFGYGITVAADCNSPSVTTGAGIARFGGPFIPLSGNVSGQGAMYTYLDDSPTHQATSCGDSGGPDIGWLGSDDFTWPHVVGVHSGNLGTNEICTATGYWLQLALNGVYLSSYLERTKNVALLGTNQLQVLAASSSSAVIMRYDPFTKQILVIGSSSARCLTSSLTLVSCTGAATERWTISRSQRIVSDAALLCLTHSGTSGIALQTCGSSADTAQRQMWAWHPQR